MEVKVINLAERIAKLLEGTDAHESLDALYLARTLVRADAARRAAQSDLESVQVQHVYP